MINPRSGYNPGDILKGISGAYGVVTFAQGIWMPYVSWYWQGVWQEPIVLLGRAYLNLAPGEEVPDEILRGSAIAALGGDLTQASSYISEP